MFIETDTKRLQNLYLLQNIIVTELDENAKTPKYTIGWVQSNGVIIKEGEFNTLQEAETKRDEIVESLLETE